MPADASIISGIKSPTLQDSMDNMSSLLGVQQKAQAIATGREQLQQAQVKTQQDQAVLQEQQALGRINPQDYLDPKTGVINADRYMKDAMNATPRTGLGVQRATQVYQAQAAQTAVSQAGQDLNRSVRTDVAGRFAALSQNPDATYNDFVRTADQIKTDNPQAGNLADSYLAQLPPSAPVSELHAKASTLNRAVLPVGENQPKPGTQDSGGSIQSGSTNPVTGAFTPAGAATQKTNAPAIITTPQGTVASATNGVLRPLSSPTVGPGAGGGTPTASSTLQPIPRPGINAPKADQDRYTQITSDASKHVQDVAAAATDVQNGVGPSRYRNDQILDLLKNNKPITGPGSDMAQYVMSKLPVWAPGGEKADAYDTIGHYLAQNSAAIAQKMGVPGTNMGAETAAASSGSLHQNRGALTEVTKVNDALNTGIDLYNRGLSKVSNNGASPEKVPAFRQAFGQNFDVNVFRYDDALRRGDTTEIDKLKTQLGSDGLKALGAKRKVLHSLADTGDLP